MSSLQHQLPPALRIRLASFHFMASQREKSTSASPNCHVTPTHERRHPRVLCRPISRAYLPAPGLSSSCSSFWVLVTVTLACPVTYGVQDRTQLHGQDFQMSRDHAQTDTKVLVFKLPIVFRVASTRSGNDITSHLVDVVFLVKGPGHPVTWHRQLVPCGPSRPSWVPLRSYRADRVLCPHVDLQIVSLAPWTSRTPARIPSEPTVARWVPTVEATRGAQAGARKPTWVLNAHWYAQAWDKKKKPVITIR